MARRKWKNGFSDKQGFTFIEIIIVLAVCGILCIVAIPMFSRYLDQCRIKVAMMQIIEMLKEGKLRALDGEDNAVVINVEKSTVTLVGGKGPDGRWNTDDDIVVRTFRLKDKGGGLKFGYGSYGPIKHGEKSDAAQADGVTFEYNRIVCNDDMTGNLGAVYIISSSGVAMAMTVNRESYWHTLYTWNGKEWVKN
ncbi:MAG TPA: prepilin-type N-terminal cleavage/methylation domain-containing protein [Geobacteraceae bacterium]|nr:prepilin-type N-terminal cleavage/methylation domain-containing protein [Geobacteraceae bacterium]